MQSRNSPLRRLAVALFIAFTAVSARAQVDNFDDGTDTGWTHYNPLGNASYSFPNVPYANYGSSNIGYEISDPAAAFGTPQGPSRAGSLWENATYSTQFSVAIDLVNWETDHDEALGILARATNPGLGTLDGYALTYSVGSTEIDLTRATNEAPTNLALTKVTALIPGHGYRLVFTGNGPNLLGQLFDDANLTTPLASVSATDSTYASGYGGLVVFDNTGSPNSDGADATFDNYAASAPEPGSAGMMGLTSVAVLLRRGRSRGSFARSHQ